eukprot:TRINITY_DN8997_c0_g1_i3.p2 TRINITY_DN8997_c0_g1~~TRINITY_DN8997_c0_g1_i3.p2  ORF type:complete len:171 (-),score=27.92 TRINITY_DN8997_c0_g1_i3:134-646(-)
MVGGGERRPEKNAGASGDGDGGVGVDDEGDPEDAEEGGARQSRTGTWNTTVLETDWFRCRCGDTEQRCGGDKGCWSSCGWSGTGDQREGQELGGRGGAAEWERWESVGGAEPVQLYRLAVLWEVAERLVQEHDPDGGATEAGGTAADARSGWEHRCRNAGCCMPCYGQTM